MPAKKITEKSTTGKRLSSGGAKTKQKNSTKTDILAKELKALIPKLDSEGLQFLIEQAQVHLYNMQVVELNRTMEKSTAMKKSTAAKAKADKPKSGLRIAGSPTGSSFYLYNGGQSVMFSRDEIIRMVTIAGAPVSKIETQENLFNWFKKERRDIFSVVPIADKFDGQLTKIAALLKKNFKVQKR